MAEQQQNLGIQDFVTFADITERLRELKEVLQIALLRLQDTDQRQAFIANVLNQVMLLPEAPTRAGMTRDFAEMEKVRAKMESVANAAQSALSQLQARQEVESYECPAGIITKT
jgi:hypothetical protein